MSKEDVVSLIVYTLMIATAAIIGFAVISPSLEGVSQINGMQITAFLILALIISVIVQVILFEVGHVLGAKIGRYKIISFNILGFCIYKTYDQKNNKFVTKFKFPKAFDGLTGETLIMPKSEKSTPIPFVWAPLFIYAIEVAFLVIAYSLISDKVKGGQNPLMFFKYFQLILVTVGGMLFIYDYFPAKLDSITDGYRLVLLNKKINIEAYNVLLNIEGDEFLGIENNTYEVFDTITDFSALVNLSTVRNYFKNEKYDEALTLLDKIIENKVKVSTETLYKAKTYKLNILIVLDKLDEAQKFFDSLGSKEKDYIKRNYSMLTIRTSILYYGILEKSQSEVNEQLRRVKKALEKESEVSKKNEKIFLEKAKEILKERVKEIKVK